MRHKIVWMGIMGIIGLIFGVAHAETAPVRIDLSALFDAAQNVETARAFKMPAFDVTLMKSDDAAWPVYAFLCGEVSRLRGEIDRAKSAYRALTEWAAADSYRDTWGGSGLAAAALWRWAQLLQPTAASDTASVEAILKAADHLKDTRFMTYMIRTPLAIIDSFPQLQEELFRQLTLLAYAAHRNDEAQQLFLSYLSIASTSELSAAETELMTQLLASGKLASPDRLALLRGKRMMAIRQYPKALEFLTTAQVSDDLQLRAEANFYMARLQRFMGKSRDQVIALLDQVLEDAENPELIRNALMERAVVWNREGKERNAAKFLDDLTQLSEDFPKSELADDALYQMARYFEYEGEIANALDSYAQLREYTGENDWKNFAYFKPALLLYNRGQPGDVAQAVELLNALETAVPNGPLHLANLFWLGRMAEESGDASDADAYFQKIVAESPYDYYAIRARMHLSGGADAKTHVYPTPEIRQELRNAYQNRGTPEQITFDSPYHLRLRQMLETGVYAKAFAANQRLREQFPSQRQEDVSLTELDQAGLLTPLCLLLALRQDALAAKDRASEPENLLQIAGVLAQVAGDLPMAMNIIKIGAESAAKRAAIQRSEQYLATAYPRIFAEEIQSAGRQYQTPPELIYAVIRQESLFYPAAFSGRGALGLFQFIPNTFAVLDQRWKLLQNSKSPSKEAFLMTPALSINLGARWLKQELLNRYAAEKFGEARMLFALMDHNAGIVAVREWIKRWQQEGRAADIEYMIDTTRFPETRIFVRSVLTDMILVDAIGVLK